MHHKSLLRYHCALAVLCLLFLTAPAMAGYPAVKGEPTVVDDNYPYGHFSRYGVDMTGATDQTSLVQKIFDAAKNGPYTRWTVTIPSGTVRITDTIYFDNVHGFVLRGESTFMSTISWAGSSTTRPALLIKDASNGLCENFRIVAAGKAKLKAAIMQVNTSTPNSVATTGNTFRKVYIDGNSPGKLDFGFYLADDATAITGLFSNALDGNNDYNRFYDCEVKHFDDTGYYIQGGQSKYNLFMSSTFNYGGNYGLRTDSGSFSWIGGGGGQSEVADFHLDSPADTVTIQGAGFEESARFLTTGNASAGFCVTLRNNRWANANTLHAAQTDMINFKMAGPLIIENNIFQVSAPATQPKIYYNFPGARVGGVVYTGNQYYRDGSVTSSPFDFPDTSGEGNDARIVVEANLWTTSNGASTSGKNLSTGSNSNYRPHVHTGNEFFLQNSGDVVINDFLSGWNGHKITITFLPNTSGSTWMNTTSSTNLAGNGGSMKQVASPTFGMVVEATYSNGKWYCSFSD